MLVAFYEVSSGVSGDFPPEDCAEESLAAVRGSFRRLYLASQCNYIKTGWGFMLAGAPGIEVKLSRLIMD